MRRLAFHAPGQELHYSYLFYSLGCSFSAVVGQDLKGGVASTHWEGKARPLDLTGMLPGFSGAPCCLMSYKAVVSSTLLLWLTVPPHFWARGAPSQIPHRLISQARLGMLQWTREGTQLLKEILNFLCLINHDKYRTRPRVGYKFSPDPEDTAPQYPTIFPEEANVQICGVSAFSQLANGGVLWHVLRWSSPDSTCAKLLSPC